MRFKLRDMVSSDPGDMGQSCPRSLWVDTQDGGGGRVDTAV